MSRQAASKRLLARVGTDVQEYRIERLIGVGGMAVVYAATHRNHHPVAIKFLLDQYTEDPDICRLFRRESYIANEVGHPGAVGVLDDGLDEEGCPFLVMPLLEGETLRARWEREGRRLRVAEVAVLMADTLSVLASAHAKGIVHRDIKPDNLFITDTGEVRVLDFGIARAENSATGSVTGRTLGTPAFMPPEQALGERTKVGPHTDCWAVGATIFALLSGEFVHEAQGAGAQLAAAATRRARSLATLMPTLPDRIVKFVDKALAFDVIDRWASAGEMRTALLEVFGQALGKSIPHVATDIRSELAAELSSSTGDIHSHETVRRSDRYQGDLAVPEHHSSSMIEIVNQASISGTGERLEPRVPRKRIWRSLLGRSGMLALLASLAAGGALWARGQRTLNHAADVQTHDAPPPLEGVPITALPIAATCTKEAEVQYRAGLMAERSAKWEIAHIHFQRAAAADPTCPEAQVQLVLTSASLAPLSEAREQFQRALAVRNSLGERDRSMLDAYAPYIAAEPADRAEWVRRVDALAVRFPRDAQVLYTAASVQVMAPKDASTIEHVLELVTRATTIDPQYADAWQSRSDALQYLGRYEEAIEALDTCLEVSPGSADCISSHMRIMHLRGQCAALVPDAQRWIAAVPTSYWAHIELANGLFLEHAPIESVEAALIQAYNNDTTSRREALRAFYARDLATLRGDFVNAERLARQMLAKLRGAGKSAIEFDQLNSLAFLADLSLETGEQVTAGEIALQILRYKRALTEGFWISKNEPFIAGLLLVQNRTSLPEWRALASSWEKRASLSFTKRQIWAFKWGPVNSLPDLAQEAWRERPDEIESAFLLGQSPEERTKAKLAEGRIALAVGENEQAVAILESAVSNCDALHAALAGVRAYFWLGQAKERVRDNAAACDAYRVVLERWGHARPRSITADAAKKHFADLRCEP